MAAHAADIVVGAVYAETGAGAQARAALGVALDIVNGSHDAVPVLMGAGGGLDRLGGAHLRFAFADETDPAAAAERLVTQEHAAVLIGGTTEPAVAAISRVAEAHGLPYLALGSNMGNGAGLTWFFRLGRTEALDARAVLRLLGQAAAASDRTFAIAALIFDDTPTGHDRIAPLHRAADAAGIKLIDTPVPAGAPLPPATAQQLAAATPDAVLSTLGGADEIARLAALPPGLGPLVLLRGGATTAPEGTFRAASFTLEPIPDRPGVTRVDALLQARTGQKLDAASAREITGALLLADVLNRAASTVPIDLRTALMATDTPGSETLMLWEGIRFDDTGQNVRATAALQQMQGPAFTTVLPDPLAVAPPHWPAKQP